MVVADPSALIAGEIAIRDRLMNSGYTVSLVDDNAVVASDAIGAAFVFVSSTVVRTRLSEPSSATCRNPCGSPSPTPSTTC